MMGHQARGESLFYYFKLEDQVPENHLLRLIDRHVNFEFIRAKMKDRYSDAGRPSRGREVKTGCAASVTKREAEDEGSITSTGYSVTD